MNAPDWYYVFPDRIASFFDKWVGDQDQWAYYLTLFIGLVLLVAVYSWCAAASAVRSSRCATTRPRPRPSASISPR